MNQELKELREALEDKSKELSERSEGAAKYDTFWQGGGEGRGGQIVFNPSALSLLRSEYVFSILFFQHVFKI